MKLRQSLALSLAVIGSFASFIIEDVKGANNFVGTTSTGANCSPITNVSNMGTPCIVTLFNGYTFNDFNPRNFTYSPTCARPWSQVVFQGNFNITQGVQYDRTATIALGGVNIYFGTTEEPTPSAQSWKVQRDLTEYSSLFYTQQPGQIILYNPVNSVDTSIIYGTSVLLFYPVQSGQQAPNVADVIYPVGGTGGAPVSLVNSTNLLSVNLNLPRNIEKVYLDVVAQSQSSDEFWYTCVPSNLSAQLDSCSNTAFRETEISIDGQPAGVAPIFPWIYTGAFDPNLWTPIPSVQTLNFQPYRVDLTPFAGVLSNNNHSHQVALSVYNANNYFSVVAALLVYLDHNSIQVTGALTKNNIGTPTPPVINTKLTKQKSRITQATILTTAVRNFTVSGYAITSHGQVYTTVSQTINFTNNQQFVNTYSNYVQNITQITNVNSITTTTAGNTSNVSVVVQNLSFPLTFNYGSSVKSNIQTTIITVQQSYQATTESGSNIMSLSDTVETTDTLVSNSAGTRSYNRTSSEYLTMTVNGNCTSQLITSANGVIT